MRFEQNILPLTEYLLENNFIVSGISLHFIKYSSKSVIITVAYDNRDHLYYIHVGQNQKTLVELTPKVAKEVFNEPTFLLQSTFTIQNLISFLQGQGNPIILGNKLKLKELTDFSNKQAQEYTAQITHLQNLQGANTAWSQKDYKDFIQCIDRTNREMLPESYLKKYKIALSKLQEL